MITYLHREPLDKLMYYDGQEDGIYNGIFNPLQYNSVFPAYYAFEGFNRLYKLGSEAELKCDSEYWRQRTEKQDLYSLQTKKINRLNISLKLREITQ